jgi:hypothetical protein
MPKFKDAVIEFSLESHPDGSRRIEGPVHR